VLDEQVPMDVAWKEAKKIGLRSKALEGKVIEYIESQQSRPESSIRPGINDRFMSGELDVSEWLGRFEVESREVFSSQKEVLDAIGLAPGSRVADIGAGTGFFARLFSEAVGDEGWVFAVDIAPSFITHIRQKSQDSRLTNLSPVLCSERSIDLPPKSIDVAFSSDTYHHFEYPQTTLSSIHRALRDGGTMVVVDFERIPGESREFILGHVRAGKKQVRGEIEAAGFEFVEEVMVSGFKENYFLRFKKR
jgi:ubiquinone/menaquinone biosynthesis C-methylase UbiE